MPPDTTTDNKIENQTDTNDKDEPAPDTDETPLSLNDDKPPY